MSLLHDVIRRPFPFVQRNITFILIGINVGIFLLTTFSPTLIGILSLNPIALVQRGYFWQIFTYLFVHANFSHLLFNMLGLFFFGMQVERAMGSWDFLLFYLLVGVLAGVFSLVTYLITNTYLVFLMGASGAVFGVLLAFATFYPTARIFIFGLFPVTAAFLVLLYAGIELLMELSGRARGVAHLTHLAGFGWAYLYLRLRSNIDPIRRLLQR